MGDHCGKTPLMAAAGSGSVRAVELLIGAGADVNAADYCGMTALMYAATSRNGDDSAQIAELLLENGADMEIVDHFGQNVWDHAEHSGMYNVTDVLKQYAK